jgi:methylenetetrahydrofolate dehydrogenase (NADP+)/methenyltetrahydrofolate cyclohydrolase
MLDYKNKIINVGDIANKIELDTKNKLLLSKATPYLITILVGDDVASAIYVKNKAKKAQELGIKNDIVNLNKDISQQELIDIISLYNTNPAITGILLQSPLPKHISFLKVISAISPSKDVDGLHPQNFGLLVNEKNNGLYTNQKNYLGYVPATPLGCMGIINNILPNITSKNAVIIGRSTLVGLPMLQLLINNDCTPTLCHSKTNNLASITKGADILISAIGSPNFITKEFIKEGALIIDVGISRILDKTTNKTKLVGDVDMQDVLPKASFITPVPGGVGKTTIASLMFNVCKNI